MNISKAFKPRTPEPILCTGNDLANVLRDIRDRGGFVNGLECMVKSNSGYRVSYFYGRVAENKDAGAGSSRSPVRQLTAHASENLATPDNFGNMAAVNSSAANQNT